jgi:hypothetical protein
MKLDAAHSRHLDVSNQASRFAEMKGCKEIGSRRECLDLVAQLPHVAVHGIPEESIIFNNRDQPHF